MLPKLICSASTFLLKSKLIYLNEYSMSPLRCINRHLKLNMSKTKILISHPLPNPCKGSPQRKHSLLLGRSSLSPLMATSLSSYLKPRVSSLSLTHTPHHIHQQILLALPKYIRTLLAPHHLQAGSLVHHHHFLGWH